MDKYVFWHQGGNLMRFRDEGDGTAALSVLAHMNNRDLLRHLTEEDRSTALHLLGIWPDDPERAATQRTAADSQANVDQFLERILVDYPDMGRVELVTE